VTTYIFNIIINHHGDKACEYQIDHFMHDTIYRLLAITRPKEWKEMGHVRILYCDMHVVGQQSTVVTLSITVAKQRTNTQQ
jgi:hypothetical protein